MRSFDLKKQNAHHRAYGRADHATNNTATYLLMLIISLLACCDLNEVKRKQTRASTPANLVNRARFPRCIISRPVRTVEQRPSTLDGIPR